MSNIKDIYRDKARFGYYCVKQVVENEDLGVNKKDFKSHIKNIPMYIYTNGLIATLTFILVKSRKNKSYEFIGKIIIDYFSKHTVFKKIEAQNVEKFIDELINAEQKDYRKYTIELISLLEWVVKFSEGMIDNDECK